MQDDPEFDEQAARVGRQAEEMRGRDRIAAASRGSGNPAALAWLAENLRVRADSTVIDLGAGLGGPAAWLRDRYRCTITCVEPAESASRELVRLFGLRVVVAAADHLPLDADSFDVGLLLGVLSVVPSPAAVLNEAGRVAQRLGVLEYCSTGHSAVRAGGSTFPTVDCLVDMLLVNGWQVEQHSPLGIATPVSWSAAADQVSVEPEPSEQEVVAAIADGRIAPVVAVAHR
jgi:SAM-dependent methyltransferase